MKTTLHVQRREFPWMVGVVRDLGSGWVKEVNPPAGDNPWPEDVKVDVRVHTDAIDAQFIPHDEGGGCDFVRHMLPRWRENPYATCYELANEPDCNSNEGLASLRRYSIGAMQEADRHGIKVCAGNLPEGNPGKNPSDDTDEKARATERWKLEQLAPAVKYTVDHEHFWGMHAYWRPGVEGPAGRWHALGRIVWDVQQWAQMGIDVSRLKLLVNETGIDGGIDSGPIETGWRDLNPNGYFLEVRDAEAFAQQYPWMKSLMLFTAGYEDPWDTFNHTEADMRAMMIALPTPEPGPPEPPINPGFTDAERASVRGAYAVIPASQKICATRGLVFHQELYEPGAPYMYIIAHKPGAGPWRLKVETGQWQVTDEEPLT